jgi:hypothetical protein
MTTNYPDDALPFAVITAELRAVQNDPDSILSPHSHHRLDALIYASVNTAQHHFGLNETDLIRIAREADPREP